MLNARPADGADGENIVLVRIQRFLDTVRGHDDGPGKDRKFLVLVLPGGPVVAVEMRVFLQARVTVCREHFAMRITKILALGLFEDRLEVAQVVP